MSTFAVYSIVYNYVDIITHPLVLVEKQIHNYRRYIEGPRVILLFTFPFFISVTWFLTCYFGLVITVEKRQMLKIPMLANYDEDSAEIMFAAGLYWSTDGKGERHWCIRDCLASLGLTMLMGICCSTILYCGIKTYQKMREMKDSLSKQTAALNNQLFLTLILQTVLPFALMYAPVGLLFFLPLFEINLGFLASSAAGSTAIYPALEPLIAIFCINLFRNTVLCRKKKISTVYDLSSTVAPA